MHRQVDEKEQKATKRALCGGLKGQEKRKEKKEEERRRKLHLHCRIIHHIRPPLAFPSGLERL
jgi:hypothetical protein